MAIMTMKPITVISATEAGSGAPATLPLDASMRGTREMLMRRLPTRQIPRTSRNQRLTSPLQAPRRAEAEQKRGSDDLQRAEVIDRLLGFLVDHRDRRRGRRLRGGALLDAFGALDHP